MCSQWYCALNENCHFANMTTVENKHCTHHLKQCGTKCKKKYLTYEMCLLFVINFFDARTLCQQLNNRFVLNAGQHRKANISFFIVLVKIFSADTFSKTVCSIYSSLIHWMFRFWASSSLLPRRIGKIMVYFVLACEN